MLCTCSCSTVFFVFRTLRRTGKKSVNLVFLLLLQFCWALGSVSEFKMVDLFETWVVGIFAVVLSASMQVVDTFSVWWTFSLLRDGNVVIGCKSIFLNLHQCFNAPSILLLQSSRNSTINNEF